MIKIVSGFSMPVGSVIALVNLCNQFNARKQDCVLYGPDRWHLDQCKSAMISAFHPEQGDIVIVHNIKLHSGGDLYKIEDRIEELRKGTWWKSLRGAVAGRLSGSRRRDGVKLILSCQENELFPIRKLRYSLFDKIHYANASQVGYHGISPPHFICPNFNDPLRPSERKPEKVAGVLGSIRRENKTDASIETALRDGMEKVILYGYLFDPLYYYDRIAPLAGKYPGRIRFAGFVDDRQRMYDSISDVYCAGRKPWSLIRTECRLTGTRYHGPAAGDDGESMTDDQRYTVWERELGL
jgi:hypothetical protein